MQRLPARLQSLTRTLMTSTGPTAGQASADTDTSAQSRPKLNVHKFPRPPLCERTDRRLQIKWNDTVVVDTNEAYWVLETTHAPTYYIPPSAVNTSAVTLSTIPRYSTMCEWKGAATYHILTNNATNESIKKKIWSYASPTPRFKDIKDYLCFYASGVPWTCYVDGEKVQPQEGDFYGGWVTSELEGPIKGGPGTWGWFLDEEKGQIHFRFFVSESRVTRSPEMMEVERTKAQEESQYKLT